MSIRATLAPYAMAIKAGIVALVFLFGLRAGCAWQADRDAAKIERKDAALLKASGDLRTAADALNAVSAHTAAEVARAAANAAQNEDAAKQAEARAKDYLGRLVRLEVEIEEAKRRSPACRARLEERPCAELR